MNTEPRRLIDPSQCPRCGGHNTAFLGSDGTPTESWLCHDCEANGEDDCCYDIIRSTQISSACWDTPDGPKEAYDSIWLARQAAPDMMDVVTDFDEAWHILQAALKQLDAHNPEMAAHARRILNDLQDAARIAIAKAEGRTA